MALMNHIYQQKKYVTEPENVNLIEKLKLGQISRIPCIFDGQNNLNQKEVANSHDLKNWWYKRVARFKQKNVRWDHFEDHIHYFLRNNILHLYDK